MSDENVSEILRKDEPGGKFGKGERGGHAKGRRGLDGDERRSRKRL